MTEYARKVKEEIRDNCIRAVKCLEQEIEQKVEEHNVELSYLQARVTSCKEIIDRLTSELAAQVKGGELMDDFMAESKGASVNLVKGLSWSFWWMDMPAVGRCLVAEYIPEDYPHFRVYGISNSEAEKLVACQKVLGWTQIGE